MDPTSIQQNPLVQTFQQLAMAARQIDDGLIAEPYILGTSALPGVVIPAGRQNVPLLQSDFSLSLEEPFRVDRIRFVNDAQHTYRNWAVRLVDYTFNQEWMKYPVVVEGLIQVDTGFWELPKPWIIRSQGGGQNWFVDNLDSVNPITIAIYLHGSRLHPSRGA
jgi:hypothetical protein